MLPELYTSPLLAHINNILRVQPLDEALKKRAMNTLSSTLNANDHKFVDLHQKNPTYITLKKKQEVIEKTIEHLNVYHSSDLNLSLMTVGMVSKKIDDAVGQMKGLRRNLQKIRDNFVSHASIATNKDETTDI